MNPADPFSNLNRPGFPPSTSAAAAALAYAAATTTSAGLWPLKSESSLLSSQEKQRREAEADRRAREEKQRQQRERDRKERESRTKVEPGFPSPLFPGQRNGTTAALASPSPSSSTSSQHRRDSSRSPVRNSPRSSLDLNRSCPSASSTPSSSLVKREDHRPSSALDMTRPAPSWSADQMLKQELRQHQQQDSDITIVSEREGNTTIAHNGGRSSADLRPPSANKRDRSPSVNSQGGGGGKDRPRSNPPNVRPSSAASRPTAAPPVVSSASSAMPPGFGGGFPGIPGMPPMSQASNMYAHLMMGAAYNPSAMFSPGGAAAMDPFRDPYRVLSMYNAAAAAKSDPLREARERELLRLNPLGSMIMNEQDKARLAAIGGYPQAPPTPGFFPPPPPSSLSMLGGFPPPPLAPPGSPMGAGPKAPPPGVPTSHLGLYPPTTAAGYHPHMHSLGGLPRLTPPLTPSMNGHSGAAAGQAPPGSKDLHVFKR
jgi:hypothetical protein